MTTKNYLSREVNNMSIKIRITKTLKETSAMTGAGNHGAAGPIGTVRAVHDFNYKEEEEQRLKGKKLEEMYSSQGIRGGTRLDKTNRNADEVHRIAMTSKGLRAHLEESEDTVERSPDQAQIPTVIDPLGNALQRTPRSALKAIKDAGYKIIGYLGGGQFGKVFKVELPDGKEQALKMVMGTPLAVNREVRNYELVQQAREKSETIAKHFPKTFASWKQDGFGFIAMEILTPVPNAADAFLVDRHNILSRDTRRGIEDKETEAGTEKYKDYKDQSKKAAMWFTTEFVDSLKGAEKFENAALVGLNNLPDMDFSDLLMEISPAAMNGLKAQSDMKKSGFADKVSEHLNLFLNNSSDLPQTARLLEIVSSETSQAPYVAVGIAMIGNVLLNIRGRAMQELGTNPSFADLDDVVFNFLIRYVRGYREFSTMRLGYDVTGPDVAAGTARESWDKISKELHDLTGLAPRDVHYGNVMQRPNGDLVIVDLGLFRNETDPKRMFESRKIRLKIVRD